MKTAIRISWLMIFHPKPHFVIYDRIPKIVNLTPYFNYRLILINSLKKNIECYHTHMRNTQMKNEQVFNLLIVLHLYICLKTCERCI